MLCTCCNNRIFLWNHSLTIPFFAPPHAVAIQDTTRTRTHNRWSVGSGNGGPFPAIAHGHGPRRPPSLASNWNQWSSVTIAGARSPPFFLHGQWKMWQSFAPQKRHQKRNLSFSVSNRQQSFTMKTHGIELPFLIFHFQHVEKMTVTSHFWTFLLLWLDPSITTCFSHVQRQQAIWFVMFISSDLLLSVWLVVIRALLSDGRTVEINTPLENSWSTKLKSITFNLNRGQLDELAQVTDSAARNANWFLKPGVFGQ